MKQTIANWIALAKYNLKSAQVLLAGGQYLSVAFELQQAVEKLLKGLYLRQTGKEAPRIHNLNKLIVLTALDSTMSSDQLRVIEDLSEYYSEVRYSEFMEDVVEVLSEEETKRIFDETTDLCNWLLLQLE